MFDPILEAAATVLAFFYSFAPDYAIAIILMTILVMIVTTPLTLKGTKGMIKMQLLQPELKKIQEKHKGGDRQEMNAELMAFYQENELNPLGGCLPLLVQAPVFLLLFNVIRGLTRTGADGTFDPRYLSTDSELYIALDDETEMFGFGLDLAESTSQALGDSIIHGLPYLFLILVMIGAQYLQQKQVSARNKDGGLAMPQQKILLRVMPAVFGVISINFPAALVVYWVTSSVYRIGLQAYITRSLYGDDDSPGAQAQKAAKKARDMGKDGKKASSDSKTGSDDETGSTGKSGKDKTGKDKTGKDDAGSANGGKPKAGGSDNGSSTGQAGPKGQNSRTSGANGGKYQPSSKKKKKKRR